MNPTTQDKPIVRQPQSAGRRPYALPLVDVESTADGYTLRAEMPGVNKSGVEITAENGDLVIIGHRAPAAAAASPNPTWSLTCFVPIKRPLFMMAIDGCQAPILPGPQRNSRSSIPPATRLVIATFHRLFGRIAALIARAAQTTSASHERIFSTLQTGFGANS